MSDAWQTGNTVPRDEAKTKIQALAVAQGVSGAFKVFYNGQLVSRPDDLPTQVDMSKVRVSAVLDQA
jgi:hypothetical protein